MPVPIDLDALLDACEWAHADTAAALGAAAYVNRLTGQIHWCGDGIDDEVPEDLDDDRIYLAVPDKGELELGRSLVFDFVDQHLPGSSQTVRRYFQQRGAYQRFKALLADAGQLDAWHRFEEAAKEKSLQAWCDANGFVPIRREERG